MLRGTRLLVGTEAAEYIEAIDKIRRFLINSGFSEIIVPSLWEQETFIAKTGNEILNQMYTFKDKGERDICLIPEITALVQQFWNESWSKCVKRPYKIFYVQRCYRYEKPQAGRYREFTQIGIEILGGKSPEDGEEATKLLKDCLSQFNIICEFVPLVKRGLSYYVEDGFEVQCNNLGAQKQGAGDTKKALDGL